jgi:uncharacterized protein YdaU (DUF1376 family)
VGIATGVKSRLVVLDVDNKNGKDGNATLEALCRQHDWHPATFTVLTASGRHLYFEHPGGKVHGGTCALGHGLDVQGDGKCVITAPSLHEAGCHYKCLDSNAAVETLPAAILGLVRAASELGNKRIVEGRNVELTSIAGRERRKGATESELADRLLSENQRKDVPLSRDEVLRIARSVARYTREEPSLYWMPLIVSDWDGSVIVKSGTSSERGMYASLIVETWRHRGFLPDDPQLWRLAQADSLEQFQQAREFLLTEFVSGDLEGRRVIVHPRIMQLWEDNARKYAQKVEAGRKSGDSRRSRKRKSLSSGIS